MRTILSLLILLVLAPVALCGQRITELYKSPPGAPASTPKYLVVDARTIYHRQNVWSPHTLLAVPWHIYPGMAFPYPPLMQAWGPRVSSFYPQMYIPTPGGFAVHVPSPWGTTTLWGDTVKLAVPPVPVQQEKK